MSQPQSAVPGEGKDHRVILGVSRRLRFRIYLWSAVAFVVGFLVWALVYLQPQRWYKYTDQVAFEQVGRDVKLGFVLWDEAEPVDSGFSREEEVGQPVISSDGARMIHVSGEADGNANLFLRLWDGTHWGEARAMRALNSSFHETAPALSGDGELLYFASDRPGGRGGYDLWVAKWDGAEYAWPLPLTGRVNTAFDEIDPAPSPDSLVLYFASNRPRPEAGKTVTVTGVLENVEELKSDYDLYSADLASETPFDLIVERRLSMLYSLREGALADPEVMRKLGGSTNSESAVDKGLAYLARTQETNGRWDIRKHGGQGGHDVAATAFALLAFYGRG
ncbi:MAG: hypothetical protein GWO24_02765, partial [Akkermansiaceae bacterium]|nr:hypothetical protein [Akkermansiaceae bacterium]